MNSLIFISPGRAGFQPIIYGKNFLLFLNSPQKKQKTQSKREKR
ncbi:hypothetical protein [Microcoleus sp. herbarium12]